ncbi:MAG: CBS domain-containing protein [Alphaproteobacteria bacterium]|nr:CBS domain-containing protein [Alphaproteobacteria bacterium]
MIDTTHDALDQLLKGQAQNLSQIMRRNILTCGPSMTVSEAANQMVTTRCSSIVVLDRGRPEGIWTEHDALLVNPDDTAALDQPVGDVMSKPVRTINQSVTIEAATLRFRDEGLRHYVVVDDKDLLVGVVSQSDVVRQQDVRHFLSMRSVSTAVRRPTLILQASSSLSQAAVRLHNHGTDCAVVIFGDGRRGIVTERDLLKAVASRRGGLKVADVSTSPIISVPQSVSVLEARETMERKGIRHLGVTDGEGTPIGLLSYADILASVEFSIMRYVEDMLAERSRALNQTQNRLRGALDELNRTNEELEEFVHAVIHGFKSPLDRMAECLEHPDPQALACARDQFTTLQAMLNGISRFAQLGHAPNSLQSIDLLSLASQVAKEESQALQDVQAKVDLSPALPRVKGDPVQLKLLLQVIVNNALRFRSPERAPLIQIMAERQSNRWIVSIVDKGRGLDPSQAERLFRLFQAEGEGAGAGVGLALARRIVERHGGRIWLESQPGQGSVVRFTLSDAEAQSASVSSS